MNRFAVVLLGSVGLVFFGCPARVSRVSSGSNVDSGSSSESADASFDASVDLADAGLRQPTLSFTIWGQLLDGGTQMLEFSDDGAEVDVLRGLVVKTVALRDSRIRVIDSADQVVASDDVGTEFDGGLSYAIEFSQPLKAGKTYNLTIEAQLGAQVIDASGNPWDDLRLTVKVRGTLEAGTRKPGKHSKRKKR